MADPEYNPEENPYEDHHDYAEKVRKGVYKMSDKYTTEESWNFWKELILNSDGSPNLEQIKKELHDFYVAMQEVPKVYMHVTGDRLSKVNYHAETVIEAADEYIDKRIEEALEDQ